MDTIALFNTKGGVGKSAVAVFLCDFLSSQHDKRVLLVDLDPQQSAAGSLLGLSKLREGFGCSASLPPLMWQATKGSPSHEQALQHVITRSAVVKNRRTNIDYLERVDVLACGREDWHNLNDKILKNLPSHQKRSFDSMLADALEPLQEDYDLCLIDLPGHAVDPITRCGIRAADWWLFVTVPDWMSTHDVESPTLLIEDVCKYSPKNVKPLGTVLSICQQKGGGEYVKSRKTLDRLSKSHLLPPLFSTNAGIAYSTDAKNALNPLTGSARTLKNKYTGQTQVLYKQIQTLANELVNRVDGGDSMDLSFDEQANQSYEDAWHA